MVQISVQDPCAANENVEAPPDNECNTRGSVRCGMTCSLEVLVPPHGLWTHP